MSGSVSVRTVTQTAITIADHGGADDSESKSSDGAEKWNSEGKLRTFLRVFEKLNMVFIVLFICYLSWTIPAHYGLYTSDSNSQKFSGNQTILLQVRARKCVWGGKGESVLPIYVEMSYGCNNGLNKVWNVYFSGISWLIVFIYVVL